MASALARQASVSCGSWSRPPWPADPRSSAGGAGERRVKLTDTSAGPAVAEHPGQLRVERVGVVSRPAQMGIGTHEHDVLAPASARPDPGHGVHTEPFGRDRRVRVADCSSGIDKRPASAQLSVKARAATAEKTLAGSPRTWTPRHSD